MKHPAPLAALAALLVPACQPITVVDQALLTSPIHDFDTRGATRSYECSLSGQIETGRATNTNVSGSCSACQ